MKYYDTFNKFAAMALQGFKQIGTAPHIQGSGHKFIFLKNDSTGECAIRVKHITDSRVWIYGSKEEANNAYINSMARA